MPGPLAVHLGHAGHEEYPALTWHIRSDDWDILAVRGVQGGDIAKKKKKRGNARDGGGSE